ncbi:MAG TPA: NADH:ubiquinone reductase (Na(+)-transporting) subunit C [Bacteroidales bacterium]|nr:NADH:ubiquinone reductase (Na(+)-transporting) subunit C [Bacteroidales bacterium]
MQSNKYIFIYSSVMVILVALILSSAAMFLRPMQERNVRIEKMQNILASINIQAPRAEAEQMFSQYIVGSKIINTKGEELQGEAFEIDLGNEIRKAPEDRQLPIFEAEVNGAKFYIVPVRGAGLWGPIWGYISLEENLTTIAGANFDHASETPGLGSQIRDMAFESQFVGKRIFDEAGNFAPVRVVRGGAQPGDLHGVDAISGGTITSRGVDNMLTEGLGNYELYFRKLKNL